MADTKDEGLKNGNGDKVEEFKITVTAKDSKGVVLGTGTCAAFSKNVAGFQKAAKKLGEPICVDLINRQLKTDARNDLARVKSVAAQVKTLEKTDAAFAAEVKALRNKWGING